MAVGRRQQLSDSEVDVVRRKRMPRYEVIQAIRAEESLVAYLMTLAFSSDPVAAMGLAGPASLHEGVSRVYQAVWWQGF
jgi:hypothetical protein